MLFLTPTFNNYNLENQRFQTPSLKLRRILIANGVYPQDYCFPETDYLRPSPGNLEDMKEIALLFKSVTMISKDEKDIMGNVIPILEGTYEERGHSCNRPFNNLRLFAPEFFCGIPDKCHRTGPTEADITVQKELEDLVLPFTLEDMPMARNFFLEVKISRVISDVANLQALHTGVLGERGQIALQGWRREGQGLDDKAHTITATYADGTLKMFSIHAERSRIQDDQLEYLMYLINSVSIIDYVERFRRGVSIFGTCVTL
ncbi:hypothetical protein EPUL_001665 [Erysiphe pulchra]|uniref:Uncharacterized protein n=1 Tax=Erysiphe pulchra TaxID=225359 RepID=A0A2S4PZM9_9PEZI|nr:hypothetical protein EPUL_001665 [Erysiphe pulchra]